MEVKLKEVNKMSEIKVFKNIDGEDFVGMHHGVSFPVKAGESVPFPTKIALHLAGQLAYKILQRKNDAKERAEIESGAKKIGEYPIEDEAKARELF